MRILALDFETKDPYISLGLGAGWVYKLWVPTSIFTVIGFSFYWIDENNDAGYLSLIDYTRAEALDILNESLKQADYVVMHNATYDLGCLLSLGIDISRIKVLDTKIIAHLVNNEEPNFSLAALSEKYLPVSQQKKKGSLIDIMIKHKLGFLRTLDDKKLASKIKQKTFNFAAMKWCYQNMDVLQETDFENMAYYATQDVIATANLLKFQLNTIQFEQAAYWSNVQKICVKLRAKGTKIDIQKIKNTIPKMEKILNSLIIECLTVFKLQHKDDLNSPAKLSSALLSMGYKLPKTAKGGDSTNAKWMKSLVNDPNIKLLIRYRTVNKIMNDFFIKPLEMQEYCCPEALIDGARYGRLFPELNLFGAAATGRFSSSCPNEQNIPKRDEEWGSLCRSIFVPEKEDGVLWTLDWCNQEGRLQASYAAKIGADGALAMCYKFQANPLLDLHQEVANLASISRSQAKPINLGISYGMQSASLAKSLNLPTKWITTSKGYRVEVAGEAADQILRKYHTAVPYIQKLIDTAKTTLIVNGSIKTLDGRRLRRSEDGRDYTGISKLIQGSALDLAIKALIEAYKQGIDVRLLIHDEFVIEGTEENARQMAYIMEHTHDNLMLPMPVEVKYGPSWGELTLFGANINNNCWISKQETG